jgi:predicted phage baseplate assembly protein
VREGSLTLLQTRPLGVREVTNPLPATGGAAPEALEDARANAPLTVLTLERIVALKDFEDFARAFAGIGKAAAVTLWNGRANTVHVTVGGADGEPLDPGSALFGNLKQAIDASRDPSVEVFVQSFVPRDFQVAATILVAPRFEAEAVLVAAGSALREQLAFARRAFGQPVTAAEVVTALQGVRGVEAVDLDRLAFAGERADPVPGAPPAFLPAAGATWPRGAPAPRPAELLRLDPQDPGAVTLTRMERPA